MNKDFIQKSLKRFLKRKVSYTLATFVAFMITGNIVCANTNDIIELRNHMNTKIEALKSAIQSKIETNESEIRKLNGDNYSLIRKGNDYSKPIFESNQGFFNFTHYNSKALKDNTTEAFAETLSAIEEKFNGKPKQLSTRVLAETYASKNPTALDRLIEGNGAVAEEKVLMTTISLGANVASPEVHIPMVKPNVSVEVNTPTIKLGNVPETPEIKVSTNVPQVPNTPSNIEIEEIEVANITAPAKVQVGKIEVNEPKIPTAPEDKDFDIPVPNVVVGFVPKQIVAPEAPTIPEIQQPKEISFTAKCKSDGNSSKFVYDDKNNSHEGVIQEVALTDGDFKILRTGSSSWTYEYENYSGVNAFSDSTSAVSDKFSDVAAKQTWNNLSRESTNDTSSHLGFQIVCGKENTGSTIFNNANFLYSRKQANKNSNIGEFAHLDWHGAIPKTRQKEGIILALNNLPNDQKEKKDIVLKAYDDAGDNFNWSVNGYNITKDVARYGWINSGNLTLEGGNISVTNFYDHTTWGAGSYRYPTETKSLTINTGNININPLKIKNNTFEKYNSVFITSDNNYQPDADRTGHIVYNGETGKINTFTKETSIFFSNHSKKRLTAMVNRGEINIYGEQSAGIYLKRPIRSKLSFVSQDFEFDNNKNEITKGNFKPIVLYGDKNIGYFGYATEGKTTGDFAVDLGAKNKGNQDFTTPEKSTDKPYTIGDKLENYSVNSGENNNIENSFGIISNENIDLSHHQIRIFDKVEKSVGVYPKADKTLTLGNGEILLDGGESEEAQENIGIYVNEKGNVVSSGDVNLLGGRENMAIYVKGSSGKTTSVANVTGDKTNDSIYIYGESGAKINVGNLAIKEAIADNIDDSTKNTTIAFANGANTQINVNADRTIAATPETPNINITGKNSKKGLAFMSKDGGQIVAKNQNINVVNGSTVVASIGTNSNVDLTGSKINYDGAGYAIYAHDKGKIDLSDVELHLGGKSTAWDLIGSNATAEDQGKAGKVITNPNTKIIVDSNDVVVFNLIGANNLNTDNLSQTINDEVTGSASGTGTTQIWKNGKDKDGKITDKYIVAAVDGGTLKVGNLDKAGTNTDTEAPKKDGYFYYRRFLGQRLNATITDGSTVQAILDSKYAKEHFHNQVAAFEMNSSSKATDNTEAQINIGTGATVKADRIDTDPKAGGAVGLFINFGKIDNKGEILVEKEADSSENKAQNQAIGIYAVNGSEVTNNGEITVGGDNSIGIFSQAYREENGEIVKDEFGKIGTDNNKGQGKINIINEKTISLDGQNAIGMYADNNSKGSTGIKDIIVHNKGIINVKSKGGIGIYGKGATITNDNPPEDLSKGMIHIGENGVGIYATDNSIIKESGGMTFSKNSIGMLLDSTSNFADDYRQSKDGKVWLVHDDTYFTDNPIGVAMKNSKEHDDRIATFPKGIHIIADDSEGGPGFKGGTVVYALNVDANFFADMKVGCHGIGFYLDNKEKDFKHEGGNYGTIDISCDDEKTIGIFGSNFVIANGSKKFKTETDLSHGIINVGGKGNIGMYTQGEGGILYQGVVADPDGKINREKTINGESHAEITITDGEKNTGMFVSNDAKAIVRNNVKFADNAKNSIGLLVTGAKAINVGDIELKSKNENNNVYIYATNKYKDMDNQEKYKNSELELAKEFTIDGDKLNTTNNSRTIGIFLNNKDEKTSNIFYGKQKITGSHPIEATGKMIVKNGAIGIYSQNHNILDNLEITGENNAIGIYADGDIDLNGKFDFTINDNSQGIILKNSKLNLNDGKIVVKNIDSDYNVTDRPEESINQELILQLGEITKTVNTLNKPVGIYADNSSIGEGNIEVKNINNSTDPALKKEMQTAIYYTSENNSESTHKANLKLNGDNLLGLYVENISVTNSGEITSNHNNIIGALIKNGKFTSDANIDLGDKNTGVYTENSTLVNNGEITANIGIQANESGEITNAGIIKAKQTGISLKGDGTNELTATNTSTIESNVGVVVENAKFENDGTIKAITDGTKVGVGIYLNGDKAQIGKLGTLDIPTKGLALYGNSVKLNDTELKLENEEIIALATKGNSELKDVDITTGKGSIGLYTIDDTKLENVKITTGENTTGLLSLGILVDNFGEQTFDNVKVDAKNGIGIYLGEKTGSSDTNNKNITYSGEITVADKGTGVFVGKDNIFTTDKFDLNVKGKDATGIYLDGGTANLGMNPTTQAEDVNLVIDGGTAVYNAGGNLNIGKVNLDIKNGGKLVYLENSGVESDANLEISGKDSYGVLGIYFDSPTATDSTIKNKGELVAKDGAIALVGIQKEGETLTTKNISIINDNTIEASGTNSIGIYTNIANVVNNSNKVINVGKNAIGINVAVSKADQEIKNEGIINLNDENSFGIIVSPTQDSLIAADIANTEIKGDAKHTKGIVLDKINLKNDLDLGTIEIGESSIGALIKNSKENGDSIQIKGNITVGDKVDDQNSVAIVAEKSDISIDNNVNIEAGKEGIGIFAKNNKVEIKNANNITVGDNGVYIFGDHADITAHGEIIADDSTAIALKGGSLTLLGSDNTISVKNSGIGIYVEEQPQNLTNLNINIEKGKSKDDQSIGIYYKDISAPLNVDVNSLTYKGDNTVAFVLENVEDAVYEEGLDLGNYNNQTGIVLHSSTLSGRGNPNVKIKLGEGKENIGVYADKHSIVNFNGSIEVGATKTADPDATNEELLKHANIGIYLENANYNNTNTNSTVTVGKNAIGIFAKVDKTSEKHNLSDKVKEITIDNGGVGIYSKALKNETTGIIDLEAKDVKLGNDQAIGIFGSGIDIDLKVDNFEIGDNHSVGILNDKGKGDIKYSGNVTIGERAVGIYKGGIDTAPKTLARATNDSNITIEAGQWKLNGYAPVGVYTDFDNVNINNKADIDMDNSTASVGIYSSGNNTITNDGIITVGKTDTQNDCSDVENHINSVGIYGTNGSKVLNTKEIIARHPHSIGAYISGKGSEFTNEGTITINNGAVGIYVKDNAIATNKGTIKVETSNSDCCNKPSIGIAAYNATIDNQGTIELANGISIYAGDNGKIINKGTIKGADGVMTSPVENTGEDLNFGDTIICKDGKMKIGSNVIVAGGNFVARKIELDGPFVDVTTGDALCEIFESSTGATGAIRILPNFIEKPGNAWTFSNVFDDLSVDGDIDIISPFGFVVNKAPDNPAENNNLNLKGNEIILAQIQPKDLIIGEQFDSIDKGIWDRKMSNEADRVAYDLDIVQWAMETEQDAIMNHHHDPRAEAAKVYAKAMNETRGFIYSTIQARMQDINRSFDDSFYDLEDKYNLTKDSNKFSLIRTNGDYKNKTLNIDDYDYNTTGLLYMKEYEGIDFGSKNGYTLGFSYSNFKFDDAYDNRKESKEKVFSLRAGIHGKRLLNDRYDIEGLSRIELGYNRHKTDRALNLRRDYVNKGRYNTYNVNWNNRINKNIFRDYSTTCNVYGLFDVEYGKVTNFKEKSGVHKLEIKSNDYTSAKAGIGANAEHKIYTHNDIIVKAKADAKYYHEFGKNNTVEKARIANTDYEYNNLLKAKKEKNNGDLTVGVGIEKAETMGVGFDITTRYSNNKKGAEVRYQVKFNYTF